MSAKPWIGGMLVMAMAISSTAAPGDESAAHAFTLDDLIAAAQRDNRELQAARYAIDVGHARLIEAGLLPNPRLEIGTASDFAFRNEGGYSASVGLSQDFPVAGRIAHQKDVARVDVALAQAEVADAERKLAGDIASSVYRVLILDRQIAARDQLIEVDQQLLTTAQARFKAAEVSELDVNTASLDLRRLQQERAVLQSQRSTTLAALNPLIGQPPGATITIHESLPVPGLVEEASLLQAKALAARPDLRIAELDADRAGAEKALAQAKRWEDWSVGVGLQQDRQVIDGAPGQSVDRALGVNLSIPLPLWNRNQAAIAEAEASGQEAHARVEAVKLAIAGEVVSAQRELASLQQVLASDRQSLLPIAQRNVALAQKGYSQGLVPLLDVVQMQRQAAELESADLDTLDRYTQALVRLRTATNEFPHLPAPAVSNGDAKVP